MARVNGTISEAFPISSDVRQGCILAANLFNTATYRILNKTTQALTLGVHYDDSGQLITYLDYADDAVIFADLFETLKEALFIFNEQSQKLGLHVNWSKTKLQSFSPWIPTRLSLAIKMRLYNSLIISIITYSSASCTLTKAQKKHLDAFNTKALRRWYDYVTNASILIRTGQPPLITTIRKLRLGAFGHICHLLPGTQAIDILASTPPASWRRP